MKRTASTAGVGGGAPGTKRAKKRARRENETLGRIAGRIAAGSTTLARSIGPFATKKFVTLEYINTPLAVGSSNFLSIPIASNSAYDVDKSTPAYFGNKQPLYYDALLSATGPYRAYKVISWKTTYTFINTATGPMRMWALPSIVNWSELDSVTECENFPGVKSGNATGSSGSSSVVTLTVTGHVSDVFPNYDGDASLVAAYNADPSSLVYGGVCLYGLDGTTALNGFLGIKHEMYVELSNVDAVAS